MTGMYKIPYLSVSLFSSNLEYHLSSLSFDFSLVTAYESRGTEAKVLTLGEETSLDNFPSLGVGWGEGGGGGER